METGRDRCRGEISHLHATDSELVRRARHGDEAAFHELVDRYAGVLFGLAFSLVGHAADAEDVVQETFSGAFRGLRAFRGFSSVKTWLIRILISWIAIETKPVMSVMTTMIMIPFPI